MDVIGGLGALAHGQGQMADGARTGAGLRRAAPSRRTLACAGCASSGRRQAALGWTRPIPASGSAAQASIRWSMCPNPCRGSRRSSSPYVSACGRPRVSPSVAVEALQIARRSGADVALSIFGAAPPRRAGALTAQQLAAYARQPGVNWYGPSDIAQVWRQHHALLMPTFGGEALPREVLIAAACTRAAIVSDVPGCRDIVPRWRGRPRGPGP